MIENMLVSKTGIHDFSKLLEKKIWTVNNDHLPFRQLLVRKQEAWTALGSLAGNGAEKDAVKEARNDYHRILHGNDAPVFSFHGCFQLYLYGIGLRHHHRPQHVECEYFLSCLLLLRCIWSRFLQPKVLIRLSLQLPCSIFCRIS